MEQSVENWLRVQLNEATAENARLRAALEEIHAGNTQSGKTEWTLGDVIQAHYKICRAALTGKGE